MALRQIAFGVFVPVIVLVVMLLLVELLLRLPAFEGFKDYEPALKAGPYAYLPNQVARHRFGTEFDTLIKVNSLGFRDDEFDSTKPTRTAVALGDSFTEGWGVDLEQSWPKQLHRELARNGGGYQHIFNAGRSATNPKNYAAVYEKFFKSNPNIDLVMVGLCLSNDVIDADTPAERISPPPTLLTRIKFFALKHSVLYNIARRSLRYNPRTELWLSRIGLTNPPSMPVDLSNAESNRRRWPYTAEFLANLGAEVRASGRRFLVILIPSKEQTLDGHVELLLEHTGAQPDDLDLFGFRDHVLRTLREMDVEVLDLTPVFDHPPGDTTANYYFRGDGHWNAAGHELAAHSVAQYLTSAPPAISVASSTPAAETREQAQVEF